MFPMVDIEENMTQIDCLQWEDSKKRDFLSMVRGWSESGQLCLTPYGLTVAAGAIGENDQALTEQEAATVSALLARGEAWELLDPETWEGGISAENDGLARWYRLASIGVETCQRFNIDAWQFADYAARMKHATKGITQEAYK